MARGNFEARLWTVPAERMKTGEVHRVPLTDEMLAILEPLQAMESEYVFEGQKSHKPLSNMAMLMLVRRMGVEGVTVHGFRSTFRHWVGEVASAPREVAELSLAHKVGSDVERAYARSDLPERRRVLMERWAGFVSGDAGKVMQIHAERVSVLQYQYPADQRRGDLHPPRQLARVRARPDAGVR